MKRLLLILCLLLVGCTCTKRRMGGTVVKKWYEPERTYTTMMPVTTMVGKTTMTTMMPMTMYDDEDFCISVKNLYFEVKDGKSIPMYITRTYWLDEETYSKIKVNDWFIPYHGIITEDKPEQRGKAEK